jgi:hypothetical protein
MAQREYRLVLTDTANGDTIDVCGDMYLLQNVMQYLNHNDLRNPQTFLHEHFLHIGENDLADLLAAWYVTKILADTDNPDWQAPKSEYDRLMALLKAQKGDR